MVCIKIFCIIIKFKNIYFESKKLILITILSIYYAFVFSKNNLLIRKNIGYKEQKTYIEKLYWNNQTHLKLEHIKEEIKQLLKTNISFDNSSDFIKREKPKISLIITLYNQNKYINSIYACIQKQELKNLEIIFIDDASKDNTIEIVEKLMEKDKRIVILKNIVNKKAFYSRNRGILFSKGEYILIIDPDDLLINNILIKAYETAKIYDLDIVQFYMMSGYKESPLLRNDLKYKGGILNNNTQIREIFYYGKSRNLCDKLVRREIYIKTIYFMKKEIYNENYQVNDDDTVFFGLVHIAKTYGFLEQIGYFYIKKKPGTYPPIVNTKNANQIFRSIFNIMKYFYIQSDNNTLEKRKMAYEYFQKSMLFFGKYINIITDGFDFIFNVFDVYINSPYFDNIQKGNLIQYKKKFLEMKKRKKIS